MRAYSLHGIVGREATLRAAAAAHPAARVDKLRFGLAFVELTDDLAAQLGEAGPGPFIEFVRLTGAAARWAQEVSARGPAAYLECEHADGAGFHAAVAWQDGRQVYGPRNDVEGREPVNHALRLLGVVAAGGKDELDAVGLLADR